MKLFLLIFLFPTELFSQDITGVWAGSMETGASKLHFELAISGSESNLSGYSLTVFTINGVDNIGVKSVTLKNKKGNVSFEDDQLIYNNYAAPAKRVKLFGSLSLIREGSSMILSGVFHTRTIDLRSNGDPGYSGTIVLKRQKNSDTSQLVSLLATLSLSDKLSFISPNAGTNQPATKPASPVRQPDSAVTTIGKKSPNADSLALVKKQLKEDQAAKAKAAQAAKKQRQDSLALARKASSPPAKVVTRPVIKKQVPEVKIAAAEIAKRKTEIIRNVFFHSDSLLLSLYDNGTVDGDTVSVVLNGKVIIARQGLSENALRVVIYMTPDLGDSCLLTMYAENLGSIPPNTGLLVIDDGNNRNEIRFEGDMQKSSAVILRRRR